MRLVSTSCQVGVEELPRLGQSRKHQLPLWFPCLIIQSQHWGLCEVRFDLLKCFLLLTAPCPLLSFAKKVSDTLCLVSEVLGKLAQLVHHAKKSSHFLRFLRWRQVCNCLKLFRICLNSTEIYNVSKELDSVCAGLAFV